MRVIVSVIACCTFLTVPLIRVRRRLEPFLDSPILPQLAITTSKIHSPEIIRRLSVTPLSYRDRRVAHVLFAPPLRLMWRSLRFPRRLQPVGVQIPRNRFPRQFERLEALGTLRVVFVSVEIRRNGKQFVDLRFDGSQTHKEAGQRLCLMALICHDLLPILRVKDARPPVGDCWIVGPLAVARFWLSQLSLSDGTATTPLPHNTTRTSRRG